MHRVGPGWSHLVGIGLRAPLFRSASMRSRDISPSASLQMASMAAFGRQRQTANHPPDWLNATFAKTLVKKTSDAPKPAPGPKFVRPDPSYLRQRALAWKSSYLELAVNQRLYINAMVCLALFLICRPILGMGNSEGLFLFFMLFWVVAIAKDLIDLFKKVQATILGKALLVVLLSLSTNLAISIASLVVNNVTGVDPSKFPHALAFVSILLIPFLVAAGFGLLYMILILAAPFAMMFLMFPDEEFRRLIMPGYKASSDLRHPVITRCVQFVSFAVFFGFAGNMSGRWAQSYDSFLSSTTLSFIYHLEMYGKAPCPLPKGARAAFTSDDRVLLGMKVRDTITVKLAQCKAPSL